MLLLNTYENNLFISQNSLINMGFLQMCLVVWATKIEHKNELFITYKEIFKKLM